jgi:L-alanine-DL-glutamate epimerase-like enolase superfamily enzyme
MLHVPNAYVMETVRGYVDGWYDDVLTDRIPIADGHLSLPDRPGLGTRMRDDLPSRPNARVEVTTLDDLRRW